ncbi:NAD-dependent dehydratase [bacterium]|nr:NAD-dependent dehydratase [bacterium]
MKVLILGGDGYIGWPLSMYLSEKGHEVHIVDNFLKRYIEAQQGVECINSPSSLVKRIKTWNEVSGKKINFTVADISENPKLLYRILEDFQPDSIVHLAEQPSAPYSMLGRSQAINTQRNNVLGTLNLIYAIQAHCPEVHLVKLGTMGEYGQPNIDIEEGWIHIEHKGRSDTLLFPKSPGSFYHASKVHDSTNLEFACRTWGHRVTDLNQGVVYGTQTGQSKMHPNLAISFHYDEIFGTVINRFITEATLGHSLTVYGNGSQTRAYIYLEDVLRCVEIAIEKPADKYQFRVFNQFTEQLSINQLADKVALAGKSLDYRVTIDHIENPRVEKENHYFNAVSTHLPNLGLNPTFLTNDLILEMLKYLSDFKDFIDKSKFMPGVKWKNH